MSQDVQNAQPATWREITVAQRQVFDSPTPETASEYRRLVESTHSSPPYHIRPILKQLERIQERTGKPPSAIKILDHGCGGGGTLMYLAAFGYSDVHGVDIGGHMDKIDRTVRAITSADKPRVSVYDGYTLPFSDGSVDLIFSQQVMEHVEDRFIESYIDEEVRILSGDGIVYHQIPHRWTPWESHTKTWFIHYLPRFIRRPVYRMFGHDPDYLDEMLHLRSPMYFYDKFRRAFPSYRNETLDRIALRPDPSYYEGNVRLRSLIARIAVLPVIRNLIVHFVMIDLTADRFTAPR
mgnify:CR=1 FL=1